MSTSRVLLSLLVVALCLALVAPADAQLARKRYEIDFFGTQINAPYSLIFIGTDCVEFRSARVVCFPATFNDCGTYEITSDDGRTIHFTARLTAAIDPLFRGPMTLHGVVQRAGRGSSLGFSFLGRFNSPLLSIPPTGTNGSGHGVQGCTVVGPDTTDPTVNWVRE